MDVLAALGFITPINQASAKGQVGKDIGKIFQPLEAIPGNRRTGLHFYRKNIWPGLEDEINFIPVAVAIKKNVTAFSTVETVLQYLYYRKVFEKIPSQGVPANMELLLQPKEISG
jgi:hypothetical protein